MLYIYCSNMYVQLFILFNCKRNQQISIVFVFSCFGNLYFSHLYSDCKLFITLQTQESKNPLNIHPTRNDMVRGGAVTPRIWSMYKVYHRVLTLISITSGYFIIYMFIHVLYSSIWAVTVAKLWIICLANVLAVG